MSLYPSLRQKHIRHSFKASCNCFGLQPDIDPVPPPLSGPRGRDWWYNQSQGSGLFYYNYFMQHTLPSFIHDAAPNWCISSIGYLEQDYAYCFTSGKYVDPPDQLLYNIWQKNLKRLSASGWYLNGLVGTYAVYDPLGWPGNIFLYDFRSIAIAGSPSDHKPRNFILRFRCDRTPITIQEPFNVLISFIGTAWPSALTIFKALLSPFSYKSTSEVYYVNGIPYISFLVPKTYCQSHGQSFFVIYSEHIFGSNPLLPFPMPPTTFYRDRTIYLPSDDSDVLFL